MMRSGKSPNMLVVGLLVIVLFVSYNYWSLSQRNTVLKNVLVADQEKLNEIEEKKIYSDKQNSINLEKLKHLEAKQQSADIALKQKDTEIGELNSKLKTKNGDLDKLDAELRNIKEKLTLCADSKSSDSDKLKTQIEDYKKNIADLTEKLKSKSGGDCDSKASQSVKEYQKLVMSEIENTVDAEVFKKIKTILEKDQSPKASSEDKKPEKVVKVPTVLSSEDLIQDVCKLPKKTGNCQNTTDRYYFDHEAGSCKIFVYSCDGNANNFEELDECRKKCEKKETELEKKDGEKVKEAIDEDELIRGASNKKLAQVKNKLNENKDEDGVEKKISGDQKEEENEAKEKKDTI